MDTGSETAPDLLSVDETLQIAIYNLPKTRLNNGYFGVVKCDDNVFTGDKIRFDVSESFVTPDETHQLQLVMKSQ